MPEINHTFELARASCFVRDSHIKILRREKQQAEVQDFDFLEFLA